MRHLFQLVFMLVIILSPAKVDAQTSQLTEKVTEDGNVSVSEDNIKELIETLESETARKEFIDNLKALVEAKDKQGEEEGSTEPIT